MGELGMSIVRIGDKIDRFITAQHCTSCFSSDDTQKGPISNQLKTWLPIIFFHFFYINEICNWLFNDIDEIYKWFFNDIK